MFDRFGVLLAVAAVWLATGIGLSVAMGRRGHDRIGWFVLGCLLGPFAVVLALDAWRHGEDVQPAQIAAPLPSGRGAVDVLVGHDGSPEADAALSTVVDLLGERIGRMTVAAVVPYGDIREQEEESSARLRQPAAGGPGPALGLEVVHGHPATVLNRLAVEGGYRMIAVGARGKGLSKALLGSAAAELACRSEVPVLIVAGAEAGHGAAAGRNRGTAASVDRGARLR